MNATTTTLSTKYQIVVPKTIRQQMHLTSGTRVEMRAVDEDMAVVVKIPTNITDKLSGLGKEMWKKLGGGDAYLKRERASWEKGKL